jgi:hypothetical protein
MSADARKKIATLADRFLQRAGSERPSESDALTTTTASRSAKVLEVERVLFQVPRRGVFDVGTGSSAASTQSESAALKKELHELMSSLASWPPPPALSYSDRPVVAQGILHALLAESAFRDLRPYLVQALVAVGGRGPDYVRDPDPATRAAFVLALSHFQPKHAPDLLKVALTDRDQEVLAFAVFAVAGLAPEKRDDALRRLLTSRLSDMAPPIHAFAVDLLAEWSTKPVAH